MFVTRRLTPFTSGAALILAAGIGLGRADEPAAAPAAAGPSPLVLGIIKDEQIVEKPFHSITDANLKTHVSDFDSNPKDLAENYAEFGLVEVPDQPTLGDGSVESSSPKDRYLKPRKPGTQPIPRQSNLWRYLNVPPGDGQVVPSQERPEPKVKSRGADGGVETKPAFRYRSLPDVSPAGALSVSYVRTAPGLFPKVDPFRYPPGANFLPTLYSDAFDMLGKPMVNTLASTPLRPYNLHDGAPVVTALPSKSSPADDLRDIMETVFELLTNRPYKQLWEELDRPKSIEDHFVNPPPRPGEKPDDYTARVRKFHVDRVQQNRELLLHNLDWAVDVITGGVDVATGRRDVATHVPSSRSYRGFGLLHHSGQNRVKRVLPVFDADGKVVGGDLDVRLIYYGGRIESDTMYVDFGDQDGLFPAETRPKPIPADAPWTITYTIDVLSRGSDDFSTMALYFAESGVKIPFPNLGMDQTFFPMTDGTRTVLKLKMPPRKYYFLNYTWGWRNHPPRVQAMENGNSTVPLVVNDAILFTRRPSHERWVFSGYDPAYDVTESEYNDALAVFGLKAGAGTGEWPTYKERQDELRALFPTVGPNSSIKRAIDRIGDLSPEKRMWRASDEGRKTLRDAGGAGTVTWEGVVQALRNLLDARDAFTDWQNRLSLPSGIRPDPASDLTLLIVNNTIYGEFTGRGQNTPERGAPADFTRGGVTDYPPWRSRDEGNVVKITVINGDYFPHGFLNLDFGGNRGWENQFKSSHALGGSGPFFTFGRFHLHLNSPLGWIAIPPAVLMEKDPADPKGEALREAVLRDPETGKEIERSQLSSNLLAPRAQSNTKQPIYDGRSPVAVRPSVHRIMLELNFEPSRRLRFYNFDPLHHDLAIFPVH